MRRLFALLPIALAAVCVRAEEKQAPPDVPKVVQLKHIEPDGKLLDLLRTLGVSASGRVAGYIALRGSKEAVAVAEEAIQKMDVPQRPQPDIDLRGWIVMNVPHGGGDREGAPLPEELEGVAKQLRAAFGYSNLRLLTGFMLRTRAEDGGNTGGQIPLVPTAPPIFYQFDFHRIDVEGDPPAPRKLHINNLALRCDVPNARPVNLSTAVDLTDGQKVVIGKTSLVSGAEIPLILVLSA